MEQKKEKMEYRADKEILGTQLKKLRHYCGYNIGDFAKLLELPLKTYTLYEESKETPPVGLLVNAANLCNTNLNYFFTRNALPIHFDIRFIKCYLYFRARVHNKLGLEKRESELYLLMEMRGHPELLRIEPLWRLWIALALSEYYPLAPELQYTACLAALPEKEIRKIGEQLNILHETDKQLRGEWFTGILYLRIKKNILWEQLGQELYDRGVKNNNLN